MPRGGKRPNSGPKKGTKYKPTLDKEAAREVLRQRVLRDLEPMIAAQIANANGIKYLVARHKSSGKFIRVTEAMAKVRLGDDEEIVEVWEKDPCVQAFTDLMNRTIDKPAEQKLSVEHSGGLVVRWQE